jgi:bacillithiol biosynthesis cysteine-adding enzyme BshC
MNSFTKNFIPFAQTGSFQKIILNYLKNEGFILNFYDFENNLTGITKRIESYRNTLIDRDKLCNALLNQYKNSGIEGPLPFEIEENIKLLRQRNTFTITAGHQLTIFGGPLYVFYKLISVINLAERLRVEFSNYNFVPVYWMASEDHDIEEISSINLFGKKYSWENSWNGMAGRMPLNNLDLLIAELKKVFGNTPYSNELIQLFEKSYTGHKNLADSTRCFINELFGKYGLVIIDGNERELKKIFSEIMVDEIQNKTSHNIISHTITELERGYPAQVKPREINLFYTGEGFRERIVEVNDEYKVLNTDIRFNSPQIAKEIRDFPEKFSPNVVLRPLYQECILPNIVFTGGPAELSYWLELKDLFNHYKVPMPVLLHRCSAMIIDKGSNEKLSKFGIKPTELFQPVEELVGNFVKEMKVDTAFFKNANEAVSTAFFELGQNISKTDSTLKATVESEFHKVTSSIKMLEEKLIRSLKKKNETEINQIRKLKEKLFPSGKLQERTESFIPFFLTDGLEFIELLKENLDPLAGEFIILQESV